MNERIALTEDVNYGDKVFKVGALATIVEDDGTKQKFIENVNKFRDILIRKTDDKDAITGFKKGLADIMNPIVCVKYDGDNMVRMICEGNFKIIKSEPKEPWYVKYIERLICWIWPNIIPKE